jgi:hypothetical protein
MTAKPAAGPPDLTDRRQRITGMVAQNAVAMVQCAIDPVQEEGQCQAIKYLFEMIELYPAAAGSEGCQAGFFNPNAFESSRVRRWKVRG